MGNNASAGGNTIPFQLAAGQSRKYTAVGDLPLTVGYAMVSASASVLGAAMFARLDGGGIFCEAGVPMAIPFGKQAVFVDTTNGFRTGSRSPTRTATLYRFIWSWSATMGKWWHRQLKTCPAFNTWRCSVMSSFLGLRLWSDGSSSGAPIRWSR